MRCEHCRKDIKGWFDHYFLKKFNICYPCACREMRGVDEKMPVEMANEVLKMFKDVRVK